MRIRRKHGVQFLQNLEPFNFKLIPTDILGGIFRRIIDPAERHKFGQHYTNEDLVDVVNAFCIRNAEANVLDPSCGSGSFLVRAYHRKAWLKQDEAANAFSRHASRPARATLRRGHLGFCRAFVHAEPGRPRHQR